MKILMIAVLVSMFSMIPAEVKQNTGEFKEVANLYEPPPSPPIPDPPPPPPPDPKRNV